MLENAGNSVPGAKARDPVTRQKRAYLPGGDKALLPQTSAACGFYACKASPCGFQQPITRPL